MPYYRKRQYRRRYRGRRKAGSWYNKRYSAMDLAKKAYSMVKYVVKNKLNTERKYIDTNVSSELIDSSGFMAHLTSIARGDTATSRDGRQVKLSRVDINVEVNLNGATADQMRFILFRNKTDQVPTIGDILDTTPYVGSMRNLNGARHYDVLRDFTVSLDADSYNIKRYKINVPLNSKCQWVIGSDSAIEWGQIYLLAVNTQSTATTALTFNSRIRFIDN